MWLEIVMKGLKSFSFIEKKYIRKYMKLEPICIKTIGKLLLKLTENVEKMSISISNQIALIFDDSNQDFCYIAGMFASFSFKNKQGFERVFFRVFQQLKKSQNTQ